MSNECLWYIQSRDPNEDREWYAAYEKIPIKKGKLGRRADLFKSFELNIKFIQKFHISMKCAVEFDFK